MQKTKQGAASLYVVVFATILFGVITVSFARIILSEAAQSSNDDLSRSAYDAALAGVEDAKVMVNKYYSCLADPTKNASYCDSEFNIFSTQTDCSNNNGYFPLAAKMHKVEGEVLLQETSLGDDSETAADQAYTCVLVTDTVPDYRGTLTTDTRTKVIPINVNGATNTSGNTTSQLQKVAYIRFAWFSELNQGENSNASNFEMSSGSTFGSNATIPPTMSLTFIKTPSTININDMHTENNTNGVIDSTMILLPSESGTNPREISSSEINAAGNAFSESGGSITNTPFEVKCTSGQEFACVATLAVEGLGLGNNDNVFLVAALPYGDAFTDFAVTLLDKDKNAIPLHGVQVSVDSTGRTNQLVRRVETRLDPADMFFPYPQYALELTGGAESTLVKNRWVTANCWSSTPGTGGALKAGKCANNGETQQ